MDWAQQLSLGGPLAVVLGAGLLALGRAYLAKDAALQQANERRVEDLKDVIRRAARSSEDDD